MVSNQRAASVTAVYLYTELEMALWAAHWTATEGPNQHAHTGTDIYKRSHMAL